MGETRGVRWALTHVRSLAEAGMSTPQQRRELRRGYEFQLLSKLTPTIEVRSRGVRYLVNTDDQAVGRTVYVDGGFDEHYMAKAVQIVETRRGTPLSGTTMLDIGANIGTSTLLALSRHNFGAVIAFEPDPINFGLLTLNTIANGFADRTTLHQLGLSNQAGSMLMSRSPANHGDRRLRTDFESDTASLYGEESWEAETVEVETLDSFEVDYDVVGCVWMDVQGHESHVLEGAQGLLASDVPIVTEYSPHLLDQVGALDRFHSLLAEEFATVIDIRADCEYPGAQAGERLASVYPPTTREFTDLALFH